jgi:hypothetical protein
MDLKNRIDQAALAPAVLEMSGLEFQVMDEPRVETSPRGGTRTAATLAGVAMVAGLALAGLLVFVSTLLRNHIAGPADVARLAPARLFATVPRVAQSKGGHGGELRARLAAIAFSGRPDGAAVDR